MKTSTLALALLLLMTAGCSTTKQVELGRQEQWMSQAQSDLLNEDAMVVMTDGRALEGTIVSLNADSVSVKGEHDLMLQARPLDHVSAIRQPGSVWPAIGGILGGAVVGALLGGMLAVENSQPQPEVLGFNTLAEGMGGMAIGGLIGAAVGGVALGLATATTDYTFLPAPVRRISPTLPQAVPDSLRTGK